MSSNAIFESLEGQVVSRSFSPGYVVLSYLVSYIGAWTTLELIDKRTAGRGLYNWYLLIGSSVSMGGIAIWCMHFIGNKAIILGGGLDVLQIAYNPGFTALSFFVPILVLLAAFLAVGSNDSVSYIRLALGGTLAGLAICGMHYLGQAGISNYNCIYQIGNVVGSAVIAIAASLVALTVFFALRASWRNSWWKRALTAVLLAGAVSGMHWLAAVGTQYQLKYTDGDQIHNISSDSTAIVVIVLSISACFILLGFTLIAQRRRSRTANRAQQVVLAAAIFDKDGRLMVTPGGLLPNQKITNTFVERSFDDIFGISHPVFLWIFRTTRNWSAISGMLPAMRNHINHAAIVKRSRPGTNSQDFDLADDHGEPIEDYSIIFRELFCIAAGDLALQMNEPLEKSGILFDEILSTGHKVKNKSRARRSAATTPNSSVDLERDGLELPTFGRGQLLFLVRHADRKDAEHLQASGYRFAAVQNVVHILSRSMQISSEDLTRRLTEMRAYTDSQKILEPGVHLGCFAIRASVNGGGFDVLVRSDARNQLPTMQLPLDNLDSWQLEYLNQLDGMTVAAISTFLKGRATNLDLSKKEQMFTAQLLETLDALCEEIQDPFFQEAMLVAKPVLAPCRGFGDDSKPAMAQLIAFRIIVPIHSRAPVQKLEFSPLQFFKTQQHVYKNSPDHAMFARKIHREFGPVLSQATFKSPISPASSSFPGVQHVRTASSHSATVDVQRRIEHGPPTLVPKNKSGRNLKFWGRKSGESERELHQVSTTRKNSETSSEKNLVDGPHPQLSFGGIMVSQEVSVDVRDMGVAQDGTELMPMKSADARVRPAMLGPMAEATKENDDDTFVDRLFAVCVVTR